MKKKSNMKVIVGIGIGLIVIMLAVVFLKKADTHYKEVESKKQTEVSDEYKKLGIMRNLTEEELKHEDAILETMDYICTRYGSNKYEYKKYEQIDSISESVYAVFKKNNEEICITRTNINGDYIYIEEPQED